MKLIYTTEEKIAIKVTLNNYEVLGSFSGPITFTVPVVKGNKEYDDIKARKLKIDNYVAPLPSVPSSVTPLQARKILRLLGYLDELEALMQNSPPEVRDEWEYASVIDRRNPLIEEFATQLNLTDEDVDNLFIQAATL